MARRFKFSLPVLVAVAVLVGLADASISHAEAVVGPPPTGTEPPAKPDDPLLNLVDQAIFRTSHRYLDASQHSAWQISHGVLALRRDFYLKTGADRINAIEWISNGAKFRGEFWFEATPYGGRAHPYNNQIKHFEGHVNQTLALVAMSNLPLDHQFKVKDGRIVTMAEMVNHSRMMANTNEETTWTLWFLTTYVDQDEQWNNAAGEPWSMEYLVRLQNRVNVTAAPCGGCHNLFALAYARNAYLRKHGRLSGAWLEADQKVQQHIAAVQALQNPDGSFSTAFFKGRGFSYKFEERINSSGHNLEWLLMALPQSRLSDQWLRRGVESLARDLINNSSQEADCGPLYHSLHSMVLYRDRVAPRPSTPAEPAELARTNPAGAVPSNPAAPTSTKVEPTQPQPVRVANLPDQGSSVAPRVAKDTDNPFPPPPPTRVPMDPAVSGPSSTEPEEEKGDLPPLPPGDSNRPGRPPSVVPSSGR